MATCIRTLISSAFPVHDVPALVELCARWSVTLTRVDVDDLTLYALSAVEAETVPIPHDPAEPVAFGDALAALIAPGWSVVLVDSARAARPLFDFCTAITPDGVHGGYRSEWHVDHDTPTGTGWAQISEQVAGARAALLAHAEETASAAGRYARGPQNGSVLLDGQRRPLTAAVLQIDPEPPAACAPAAQPGSDTAQTPIDGSADGTADDALLF